MKRLIALFVVVGVGLAGCVGIPTSGGVTAGGVIGTESDPIYALLPSGPQDDAPQDEIVTGFINAATNPQGNYEVAREFLSKDFASSWKPNTTTQIRSGTGIPQEVTETSYTYSMISSAFVDASGQYFEQPSATQVLDFTLVQDAKKQWRISSAPDGIVLSREAFSTIFEPRPLYFYDSTFQYLVPDIRWFARTDLQATRLVSALLAGPSPLLQKGVTNSEFPTGTTLASSVVIDSGTATVDLSDDALAATPAKRERMQEQLKETIGGSVSTVTITVQGVAIDVPDTGSPPAITDPSVLGQPLVRTEDAFGFLTASGSVSAVTGQSADIIALGGVAVTLASDRKSSAVLTPTGVYSIFSDGTDPLLVDKRGGLAAPSIDNLGFTWSVPSNDVHGLTAFDKKGTAYPIDTTALPDAEVTSFAVSREGTRVLLLLSTDVGPKLFVAGILRPDSVPNALGTAVELGLDESTHPVSATWVDASTVATVTTGTNDSFSTATAYQLGGQVTSLGRVLGGTQIVGGNGGVDGLRVLGAEGHIYSPRGISWVDTSDVVSFLGTQQ